jgi:hypothetical protein
MPVAKHEMFEFGGVDAHSNPTNYPANRALRCRNWVPQSSGALRLRDGYTLPPGATADGIPIHSMLYYEQFAANYLGPQYVLYGKGASLDILNIKTGMVNLAPAGRRMSPPVIATAVDGGAGGTLAAGTYYYVITALDASGGETNASNEVHLAIASGHKIVLSWAAVPTATGYRIYRGPGPGGETRMAGPGLPVTTNSFTDDGTDVAASAIAIDTITAAGNNSTNATVRLAAPDTALLAVGDVVTIIGSVGSVQDGDGQEITRPIAFTTPDPTVAGTTSLNNRAFDNPNLAIDRDGQSASEGTSRIGPISYGYATCRWFGFANPAVPYRQAVLSVKSDAGVFHADAYLEFSLDGGVTWTPWYFFTSTGTANRGIAITSTLLPDGQDLSRIVVRAVAQGPGTGLAHSFVYDVYIAGLLSDTSGAGNLNISATIIAILDSSTVVVSAPIFTLAGTGGPSSATATAQVLQDGSVIGETGPAWDTATGSAVVFMPAVSGEGATERSNDLFAEGFALPVPDNTEITGLALFIDRQADTFDNISDLQVEVHVNGVDSPNIAQVGPWDTDARIIQYGSQFDLLGLSLLPSDFNGGLVSFSIAVAAGPIPPPYTGNFVTVLDAAMTVYFTSPAIGLQWVGGTMQLVTNGPPAFNTTALNQSAQMGGPNPWGHFRAKNRVFLSSGAPWSGRFFTADQVSWDGANLRPAGLPALSVFSNATGGPVVVSIIPSPSGSIAPTTLTGYQFFGAIYNPNTQHMGNRFPLGDRQTVADTLSAVQLVGLPNPNFAGGTDPYPEWVLAIGMTNDGGEVPYWMTDQYGNNIIVGNTNSTAIILVSEINPLQELPFRNDIPPKLDKFARVGTRIFGALAGDPFLHYSNDEADVSNADYVGQPVESWPPDQVEPLPTGELPTAIHGYRLEGWFFSRNNLCIWSQFLLQQGANPWRGPWPGGCAGQRAFIETPHGPFWVTPQKELVTFSEDGVIEVSEEYQRGLLEKIADQFIGQIEIGYASDPEQLIDRLVIRGTDISGNPVVVFHDFGLRDARSRTGQGYEAEYGNLTIRTFAGAGFTPRQNVYDANGKMRLWAGSVEGFIAQMDDGPSDNGEQFDADYLWLISLGPNMPGLAELQFQGDGKIEFSYLPVINGDLDAMRPAPVQLIPGETSRYAATMSGEGRWVYIRAQLTSHSKDVEADTDPPFMPMPTYGAINEGVLRLGRERPEAR